ncbi:MAG: hypothetical protein UR28_C0018G0021 [Candidatus Peregrinibacteria bacterium GW2011_GWF2_33_10]|nr:MAG: hypothetical protein UR28_C0018G0021 [Candidatus Peregrinibacteria bacterium GW2011_GWF2_33_10]OGJ44698.1 MAG: hypothetical protein A2272_02375 [Candidatus Peregrinibacteria bacterium RIFOXYA12_FULL_33_12]OGJ46215.1 MAG: hypothetical protein A2263_05005 [Candidatus Peregrinibacteria bacterium RIFOXYA2_FULL_33_21]OGJ51631.1 MAG: hypothetical protein A2307_04175 [Candidatus Peregrinibacteria bacterium RIFOXYB2_FULL_33_20]
MGTYSSLFKEQRVLNKSETTEAGNSQPTLARQYSRETRDEPVAELDQKTAPRNEKIAYIRFREARLNNNNYARQSFDKAIILLKNLLNDQRRLAYITEEIGYDLALEIDPSNDSPSNSTQSKNSLSNTSLYIILDKVLATYISAQNISLVRQNSSLVRRLTRKLLRKEPSITERIQEMAMSITVPDDWEEIPISEVITGPTKVDNSVKIITPTSPIVHPFCDVQADSNNIIINSYIDDIDDDGGIHLGYNAEDLKLENFVSDDEEVDDTVKIISGNTAQPPEISE